MAFSISLTPTDTARRIGHGVLIIDDAREEFRVDLALWSPRTYQEHWQAAARRVLSQDAGALFIASLTDPATSNFISVWPCYRLHDEVFFQHHLLFLDELTSPFDPGNPHAHLPPREKNGEDGEPLSEWQTATSELQRFAARATAEQHNDESAK